MASEKIAPALSDMAERQRHEHVFLGAAHEENERRSSLVVVVTALMMTVEIVGGQVLGSMALVADGWHMATHVAALGIAAAAYRFARTHQHDPRFSFGTGKLGELAGFGSAIILVMIAFYIGAESVERLFDPVPIAFAEAIPVAALGLVVNLVSAWLLHGRHGEHENHGHAHHAPSAHHDHHENAQDHAHTADDSNFRAAYLHVLADALTSLTAIVALSFGYVFGWTWLDPVMGLVGTMVIVLWSWSLMKGASATLLDMVPSGRMAEAIRAAIESDGDALADLHVWRVGPGHSAAILSIVADVPRGPEAYKHRLKAIPGLSHVTVEVVPTEPERKAA